ncbi:MAG: 4Fe-4S dicluster domain-containing protein [Planctomycetota bacterium]|nr:4Fe-4S dicluster domain-containing protein [Planctomycetota bacterium]MDI6786937.1 4Fe-4S dicluster domain-containing protein [Planctomycetota bacterium]
MYLDVDATKCTGCRVCLTICSLYHFKEINPKKAALTIDATFPKPGKYEPRVCNQCGICASVCPVEAISLPARPQPDQAVLAGDARSGGKEGAYIIDSEKCNGCGECVRECPTQVMFLHEDSSVPIKCDLCKECIPVCAPGVLFIKDENK